MKYQLFYGTFPESPRQNQYQIVFPERGLAFLVGNVKPTWKQIRKLKQQMYDTGMDYMPKESDYGIPRVLLDIIDAMGDKLASTQGRFPAQAYTKGDSLSHRIWIAGIEEFDGGELVPDYYGITIRKAFSMLMAEIPLNDGRLLYMVAGYTRDHITQILTMRA